MYYDMECAESVPSKITAFMNLLSEILTCLFKWFCNLLYLKECIFFFEFPCDWMNALCGHKLYR